MFRKLTVLFAPYDFVGHVNACIGIAEVLKDRGHRIVFAISDQWKGKINKYGFEEEITIISKSEPIKDPLKYWTEFISSSGIFGPIPPIDKIKSMNANGFDQIIISTKNSDPIMKDIVNRIKPDVIVIDGFVYMPSLMNCGVPWVWSMSCNPLLIDYATNDDMSPPSGLEGYPSLPKDKLIIPSPYLNIYMFPEELDYTDIRQLPSNWHRFDCFMRSSDQDIFEIPEKIRKISGKLIYLSMGSMGGADVNLMKRLVSILSKSKHRFIVSKGPLSDQYELTENMWGERTIPQIKVLPIVDLVVTHGGNNTITETFFFGKPMIVMPLFFDQYDNAQRIQEKGLGIRLDPYECTGTELLESIENLLIDVKLATKLKRVSERIQTSKSISKVAELIESLVQ